MDPDCRKNLCERFLLHVLGAAFDGFRDPFVDRPVEFVLASELVQRVPSGYVLDTVAERQFSECELNAIGLVTAGHCPFVLLVNDGV